MKIKINNLIKLIKLNKLNEDETANNVKTESTAFDLFEADAQYQYILQRKKEALPVNIILPPGFDRPLRLPNPPEDISNIMSSYKNNKARKTKNIGGVMQDPILTFNLADACCKDAFGNFSEISFEKDEKKRDLNTSNIIKSKSNESYNYKDFPVLNESPVITGLEAGTAIGSAANAGIAAGAGLVAGLAKTVGASVAAICTGGYLTGYYGEEILGNVEPGGISNDEVVASLNAQSQKMLTPKAVNPQQYKDIVEAITDYIKNIMEACTDVAGILTTEGAQKMDELTSFVNKLMNTTSKKAIEFIEMHSKQIEEEKELERQRKELKLLSDKIKSDKVKTFIQNSLQALAGSGTKNYPTELKLLQQIQQYYENRQNKPEEVELDSALQNNGWNGLKTKYNELKKQDKKENNIEDGNISTSVKIDYTNELNEEGKSLTGIKNEEHDTPNKVLIEADIIYNKLLLEFEDRFKKEVFSKIDTKSLPKYEETKQLMQDLIDAADKSINSKIEQITKVQNGETSANAGLGQAAKVFLMGHPLEANNLREVWSRHLVDLKSRMTNRLTQMTDYRNKTRTLGWTWEVCRTIMPKVLARMLTYRYIYAILSNKGFFSYDTATMEADKKAFLKDKGNYIALKESKLIWLLNQSNEYTSNNELLLIPDSTNGGWNISSNLSYAYFLITRLSGINSIADAKIATTAEFLSNIKAYVKGEDLVKKLLTVIDGALSDTNKSLLNSNDPEKFNQLAEVFKMPDDIKAIKGEIKTTYDNLAKLRTTIQSDREKLVNIAKSIDLVNLNPIKIYNAYIKNLGVIEDEIISKLNDNQLQENIKTKVTKIFGELINGDKLEKENYNKITVENIQNYLPDGKSSDDYFAQILFAYPKKLLKNKSITAKDVSEICKVINVLSKIEFNGLLAYALDKDNEQPESNGGLLTEMANAWQASEITKLYSLVNSNNSENFNAAYDKIKNKDQVKELLANGPFKNLKENKVVSEFKANYESKKDKLPLAISNTDLLNLELSIHAFDNLIKNISPEVKDKDSILGILTVNEGKENKEITLSNEDDTIKQEVESLKLVISFVMEVVVNTELEKDVNSIKTITDDDLTKDITVLGNMEDTAAAIQDFCNGIVETENSISTKVGKYADANNREEAKENINALKILKTKFINSYISFIKTDSNNKLQITENDFNNILDAFRNETSVNVLIENNTPLKSIKFGEKIYDECTPEEKKEILYYLINALNKDRIEHNKFMNAFILAIEKLVKK